MDFEGRGFVTQDDFMRVYPRLKLPFSAESMKEYLNTGDYFKANDGKLVLEKFTTLFFPDILQTEEEQEEIKIDEKLPDSLK